MDHSVCLSVLGFFGAVVFLLLLGWRQGASLFAYLPPVRGRQASTSTTPSRTLSPAEKATNNETATPQGLIDFKTVLPPSSREGLMRAANQLPPTKPKPFLKKPFNEVEFRKGILSFEADYRECGPSSYTPTGISLQEVRALGDFPDYSELCGVPLPNPYKGFRYETALPRPYRPFRWAYHQTMSLTKMETDWWLEVDRDYISTVKYRIELFAKHGKQVLDCLPGSELAAKELMEMALQFYCARYPQHFSLNHEPCQGYIFHNGLLQTKSVLKDHHPLQVLLHNIPEDFAIILRNPLDGKYYFRAGVICSSLGWNVSTKIGMQLKEIHAPIPDYKEKMEFSMDRYFAKMPPNRPIQRGSWGLEVDTPLFMPPGDPHELHRLSQDPSLTLSRCNLRVDWQTLRRLPVSGAIVFNFKGLFTPVEAFRDEPYIPSLVRKVLLNGKKNMMEYKSTWHVEHVVIPALKRWEKEQVEKGLMEENWEVETLKESPWFPGWKEKWHREQGF